MPEKLLPDMCHLRTKFTQGKKGSVVAVSDVTFQTEKGEILGLAGGSGCGKSVMALSVMSLLKDIPNEIMDGKVYLEDNSLFRRLEEEMRKIRGESVSMISQEAMSSLNSVIRVNAQLVEAILLHTDKTKHKAEKHALKILGQVSIPDPACAGRSYPHQLLGDTSQRVVVAVAVSCDPHLLVADEPTTMLDVTIQTQILDSMRKIQQEIRTGILLITHDLGVAAEVCSRIIVMYAGRIVEEALVQYLFHEPIHPYTKGLITSVPKLGSGVMSLPSIPGSVPDLSMMPPGCKFALRCRYAQDRYCEEEPPLVELNGGRRCRCVLVQDKEVTVE